MNCHSQSYFRDIYTSFLVAKLYFRLSAWYKSSTSLQWISWFNLFYFLNIHMNWSLMEEGKKLKR